MLFICLYHCLYSYLSACLCVPLATLCSVCYVFASSIVFSCSSVLSVVYYSVCYFLFFIFCLYIPLSYSLWCLLCISSTIACSYPSVCQCAVQLFSILSVIYMRPPFSVVPRLCAFQLFFIISVIYFLPPMSVVTRLCVCASVCCSRPGVCCLLPSARCVRLIASRMCGSI